MLRASPGASLAFLKPERNRSKKAPPIFKGQIQSGTGRPARVLPETHEHHGSPPFRRRIGSRSRHTIHSPGKPSTMARMKKAGQPMLSDNTPASGLT